MKEIYMIYLNSDDFAWATESCQKTELFGVKGIKGSIVNKCWCEGKEVFIPEDEISSIVKFDSIEDYLHSKDKFEKEDQKQEESK